MKKSVYSSALIGSLLLLFILLTSLFFDYSYTLSIYSIIFFIEIISVLIYLIILNRNYFVKIKPIKENKTIFTLLTFWLILILPFNLFWANLTFDNISMSLYGFSIDLFRSLPNYLVIIPLVLSLYFELLADN